MILILDGGDGDGDWGMYETEKEEIGSLGSGIRGLISLPPSSHTSSQTTMQTTFGGVLVGLSRRGNLGVYSRQHDTGWDGNQWDQLHDRGCSALCSLGPHQSWIASGGRDARIRVWDLEASSSGGAGMGLVWDVWRARNLVTGLGSWHVEGGGGGEEGGNPYLLVQTGEDLAARVWDTRVASGQGPVLVWSGLVNIPKCLAVDARHEHVFATGANGFDGDGCEINMFDLRMPASPLARLEGAHSQAVRGLSFGPNVDGNPTLISAGADGKVVASVWGGDDGRAQVVSSVSDLGSGPLSTLAVCLESRNVYASGEDGSLFIWRISPSTRLGGDSEEELGLEPVAAYTNGS